MERWDNIIHKNFLSTLLLFITGFLLGQNKCEAAPKQLVMELGLICDMEFSKVFDFDKQKIAEFWILELLAQDVNFQTLTAVKLSFKLTSLIVINQTSDQPFVESSRYTNGSTDLGKILSSVQNWSQRKNWFHTADVTILVTGSRGKYGSQYFLDSVCKRTGSNGMYIMGVFRSGVSNMHSNQELGSFFGLVIGAKMEKCVPHTGITAYTTVFPSVHYFSNCSNEGVFNYTNSMDISCLNHLDHQEISSGLSKVYTRRATVLDQCRLKYGNKNIDSTTAWKFGECNVEDCLADGKQVGDVQVLYNTPCGSRKSCFRGQCLQEGSLLKNLDSGMCLLTSYTLAFNNYVGLQTCPKYSLRFDRVLLRELKDGGVQIVATHNTVEITEKCLQLNTDSTFVVFGHCSSPNTSVWDLIFVDKARNKFRLCHRQTRSCATWVTRQNLVTMSALNVHTSLQEWILKDFNFTKELPSSQFLEVNSDVANLYQPIKIVVKLLLVCDYECGTIFAFNKTATENYWRVAIVDTQSKFQTIPQFEITFLVISKFFIWSQEESWFTFSSKALNKTITVNEAFSEWIYTQLNFSAEFHIAILATGGRLSGQKVVAPAASACQVNHAQRKFLPTITIRTDVLSSNPCENLAHAIKTVLSATHSQEFTQDTCFSQHCNQTLFGHHYFSTCEEILLRRFILSANASCLYNSTELSETKLELADSIIIFPTIAEQCSLPNKPAVGKYQNCNAAYCFPKYRASTSSIGVIYPVYKTSCGKNLVCFRGRCVPQGYQLQHVFSEYCLSGLDIFASNDKLTLGPCRNVATAVYSFSIIYASNGSVLLSTPYATVGSHQNGDKCIAVSTNAVEISYKPCLEGQYSPDFEWKLKEVTAKKNIYIIYHANIGKCLSSNYENQIVLTTLCGQFNSKAQWKYLKKQQAVLYEKPTTTASATSTLNSADVAEHVANEGTTSSTDELGFKIFVYTSVSVITFVILFGILYWLRRRYIRKNLQIEETIRRISVQSFYTVQNSNPESVGTSKVTNNSSLQNKWEFPVNRLKLGLIIKTGSLKITTNILTAEQLLGSGAFGSVYQAEALGILEEGKTTKVAVKTVPMTPMVGDMTPLKALVEELKILCQLGAHLNVVNLLGACTVDFPITRKLYVIIEYCKYGNIRRYMINNRKTFVNKVHLFDDGIHACTSNTDDKRSSANSTSVKEDSGESRVKAYQANLEATSIDTQDVLSWAYQIAQGMEYITSKKILHGDLAARNILLAEHNIAKICDFGLSKKLHKAYNYNYKKRPKKELLPYKWMALESVTYGLFSSQSDCWAFGVVLWELFTLGDTPYPAMQVDPEFVKKLQSGYRMSKPAYAPSGVYEIMLQCWSEDPSKRPKFTELAERLGNMLDSVVESFYINLNLELQQQRNQKYYASSIIEPGDSSNETSK